jgi:hypothetical protein
MVSITQLRLISRCTQGRNHAVRLTASEFHLNEDVQSSEVIVGFPDFVHPLLEALFSEDLKLLILQFTERFTQMVFMTGVEPPDVYISV